MGKEEFKRKLFLVGDMVKPEEQDFLRFMREKGCPVERVCDEYRLQVDA